MGLFLFQLPHQANAPQGPRRFPFSRVIMANESGSWSTDQVPLFFQTWPVFGEEADDPGRRKSS